MGTTRWITLYYDDSEKISLSGRIFALVEDIPIFLFSCEGAPQRRTTSLEDCYKWRAEAPAL